MHNRIEDPSRLEGDALDKWYRRSPDEIAEERRYAEQDRYAEFFGPLALLEAPLRPPPLRPAPVRPPPSRAAVPPRDGAPPAAGAPGSFFASYRDPVTGRPFPLNVVEPSLVAKDYYVIGGNKLVSRDEVERIHSEQQRRIHGQELEPSPYARAIDRLQDGHIPRADQLEKGMWERDPTCHPYGGWEIDPGFEWYSKESQDYEEQVAGARGVDYVVRPPGRLRGVAFDGCDVGRRVLEEAKGPGYEALLPKPFGKGVVDKLEEQARRQTEVALDRPIEWYFAEDPTREAFKKRNSTGPIRAFHVPAR